MSSDYCCDVSCIDQEKINAVAPHLLSAEATVRLAETFRLLGDPTRVRIIQALSLEELCVCDIAALLGASISAVSHQLRLLRSMQVVRFRKSGKIVYYTLDDAHVRNLLQAGVDHIRECLLPAKERREVRP
ncbi:ArsR/SmtB family transcription factor [Trichlorobacter ammonificans]|uniref:Transcriptional repressor SmtB homolog n=1 Tax=Trichlorobacter ammonificans TaxID=2916410 RepID=A0ABN8HGZ2_9BACT|nr:metalloregulator ArsR/SmtB family transcription factor [Trichlorobacter ammonificans]CAH2030254.1 Transcriptional repressor SmtB homolog [Trichlorobacter ammonificans]